MDFLFYNWCTTTSLTRQNYFLIKKPIRDPHCEAGTTSRKVIGGLGTVPGVSRVFKS